MRSRGCSDTTRYGLSAGAISLLFDSFAIARAQCVGAAESDAWTTNIVSPSENIVVTRTSFL